MSNNIIPKEQLTAYQRWELAAFDEERLEQVGAEPATVSDELVMVPVEEVVQDVVDAPVQENLPYPTAEEIESIHQQAYQEAYQEAFGEGQKAGFEQGFEQGLSEGRLTGAAEIAQLKQVIHQINAVREAFENDIAQDVLTLVLEVARQVLRQSIAVKPEMLAAVIREAVASLPAITQTPRIVLNPADLAAVEVVLGNELQSGWNLIPDESIKVGGCRILAGNSEIDAEIATRWQRVIATLGQQTDWLD
ncbi:flagellar assembly protein FliH [Chitinivorax sp. B]|uniref:flagellar assembly protein FliH n=1 Tax=Chitinivorax sp. B TaxID=2502235 RepID=UPI001484D21D|nr:flagellar assembly protein FliH [Chitinivorax sp. B]